MELAQTINWSVDLIDSLLPGARPEWEETTMWQHREFHLAPKDHWEVNGILDFLQQWKELALPSVLAIFGPSEGRDTWVTEFSLDLIQACKLQGGSVASAMCDRPDGQLFTPTTVIKKLICQLLEQNPRLILEAPEVLNLRVCRAIQDFDQACYLFTSVVTAVTTPLTVIIDRIDCCEASPTHDDESQNLVEFFSQLITKQSPQLKVIITSGDELPEGGIQSSDLALSACMIDSRKRHHRRDEIPALGHRLVFNVHTFRHNEFDRGQRRRAFGLEQLYRMRKSMLNKCNDISWDQKLVPKTDRQQMILRYFRMERFRGRKQGIHIYDPPMM